MSETVLRYRDADAECQGLLIRSTTAIGPQPGVLLVHDIRGVGPYPKAHIAALLSLGCIVLVADMFGNGINPEFEIGRKLIGGLQESTQRWRARVGAALAALSEAPDVDSSRLAAVGYCFGGSTVLELALSGAPLRAAVSLHGGLDRVSLRDADKIKASVLACIGAEDPLVTPESVLAFQSALRAGGTNDWQVLTLSGAKHSYTNPEAPESPATGYHERADRRSLAAMMMFLTETLRLPRPA
jgi:dienelactone hydrolase